MSERWHSFTARVLRKLTATPWQFNLLEVNGTTRFWALRWPIIGENSWTHTNKPTFSPPSTVQPITVTHLNWSSSHLGYRPTLKQTTTINWLDWFCLYINWNCRNKRPCTQMIGSSDGSNGDSALVQLTLHTLQGSLPRLHAAPSTPPPSSPPPSFGGLLSKTSHLG